jgi:hypothetical protein
MRLEPIALRLVGWDRDLLRNETNSNVEAGKLPWLCGIKLIDFCGETFVKECSWIPNEGRSSSLEKKLEKGK